MRSGRVGVVLLSVWLALVAFALIPGGAGGAAGATPTACPADSGAWRAGAAKADITPTVWPVGEAAYSIGRIATSAAHPFYARAVALQSCANGQIIVITALDSQGYFAGYKEDPGAGTAGYGTAAIRQIVAADTGVPASNILIAATHTHNSPDSVGVWGGGSVANNKAPYLSRVKSQTVTAIEAAIAALRPARLRVGTADIAALLGTYTQVRRDPKDYPTDHVLRVLQATSATDCSPIATLVNAGVHADVAGQLGSSPHDIIDPDWPGRVATDLERTLPGDGAVVMAGAVGRTGPSFPSGTDPNSKSQLEEIAAYGDVMARRTYTALAGSAPVPAGPVGVTEVHLQEEIAEPALIPLFADETGIPNPQGGLVLGGVMRSIVPPFSTGNVLDADVQTFHAGALLMAGAPGEAYPEVSTVLASGVHSLIAPPFVFGLANDQLGYTPPAFEYPVVALADGGDEGFFTINAHFGDDLINQHLTAAAAFGFPTDGSYNGATAGPVNPPDQNTTYTPPPNPTEPAELDPSLHCDQAGDELGTDTTTLSPGAPIAAVTHAGSQISVAGIKITLPQTRRCVSARRFRIHVSAGGGSTVLGASVTIAGRRFAVHLGRSPSALVDLRGLPRGAFKLRLLARLRIRGHVRTLRATRLFHTCVPARGH